MTTPKFSVFTAATESLGDRRVKILSGPRARLKAGQVNEQAKLGAEVASQGQDGGGAFALPQAADLLEVHAALLARSAFAEEDSLRDSFSLGAQENPGEVVTRSGLDPLSWQSSNDVPELGLPGRVDSFAKLAQASAGALSDLPAKQVESIAASTQGLTLPVVGLAAAGAVIAGVAGGVSGGVSGAVGRVTKVITVADDYLKDAKVMVDLDGNGIAETPAEPVKKLDGTPDAGKYQVTIEAGKSLGVITASGGYYTDSRGIRVENKLELTTPAGWVLVNPITTLVGTLVNSKAISDRSLAESAVESALGLKDLGLDLGSFDPFAEGNKGNAVQVQKAALGLVSLISALEGSGIQEAKIWSAIAAAVTPSSDSTPGNSPPSLLGDAGLTSVFSTVQKDAPLLDVTLVKGQVVSVLNSIAKVTSLQELPSDLVAPIVEITSDKTKLKAGETAALSFTLSEAATDFDVGDVTVSGGSLSAFSGSGTNYTAIFTPDAGVEGLAAKITVAAGSFTDAAGNAGHAGATPLVQIDTQAPLASEITAELVHDEVNDDGDSSTDNVTSNHSPLLQGTAEAGSTVTVSFDGLDVVGQAEVDGQGNWSLQLEELGFGRWTPIVQATDAAGNVSEPVIGTEFTIQPRVSAGLRHDEDNDTGVSISDNQTNNPHPTLEGYSVPYASLRIELGGQTYEVKAGDDGVWSVDVEADLADGDYTPTIATLGVEGVSEDPIDGTPFTVDTEAPDSSAVTVALDPESDTGVYNYDGLTSTTTPTFVGEAPPGLVIRLMFNGEPYGDPVTVGDDGKWSISVGSLEAGIWTPTVTVEDLAGNKGTSEGSPFEIVTESAVSTIGLDASSEPMSDTGASPDDGVTNNPLPTFKGTVDLMRAGTTVTVTLVSDTVTVSSDPIEPDPDTGDWTYTPSENLVDGEYTATVVVNDAVGLVSPEETLPVVIDTQAPLASEITAELVHDEVNDDGDSSTDNVTSNHSPLLQGTAEAGSTVTVSFDGLDVVGQAEVDGQGNWSLQLEELGFGRWTPIVQATDAAGNVSEPVIGTEFTIQPRVSAGLRHDEDNDTGVSISDNQTNNPHPTLEGYSVPYASLRIELGGQTYEVKAGDDGVWSVDVEADLADGDYTPTIATLGVEGVSEDPIDGTPFTVDTEAPDSSAVTVALDPESDTGVYNYDGLTSTTTPTFVGEAPPGLVIRLMFNGEPYGDPVTVGDDGKWSISVGSLEAGIWTPTVTVEDLAGNKGTSEGSPFEIVTESAVSTIGLDASSEPMSDTGASPDDGVTNNPLPTFKGTVDLMRAGTTVTVTLVSDTVTVSSDPIEPDPDTGDWTYTPSENLVDGEYTATVVVNDAVGLVSPEETLPVVIDTQAPVLVPVANFVQVPDAEFSVNPTYAQLADTDAVQFEDVGDLLTTIGFDFSTETGSVSAPSGFKVIGPPSFGWVRATATDLAGNVSTDEFQVAAVTKKTPITSSSYSVNDASGEPILYVDKASNNLSLTLTSTSGSVVQTGDGNDTVTLNGEDFDVMNFAAIDGGAGTADALTLNSMSGNLEIDLGGFNQAGENGDGKVLVHFERLNFSISTAKSGNLIVSPEDLYRQASDLTDTVGGGSWSTLVVTGNADDKVTLKSIDLSADDAVDQDFFQVGGVGKFTSTGAEGSGYTKLRAFVSDAAGSHGVELLIASAVTVYNPDDIGLTRTPPVLG